MVEVKAVRAVAKRKGELTLLQLQVVEDRLYLEEFR